MHLGLGRTRRDMLNCRQGALANQALLDQQALLEQRIDEAQVAAILKTKGSVASTSSPTSPVEPNPVRNGSVQADKRLLPVDPRS